MLIPPEFSQTEKEQPLPSVMTLKLGSWATKAYSYPIFSATWFRYRALSFMFPMAILTFALSVIFYVMINESILMLLILDVVLLWFSVFTLLLLGRYLAVRVCKQNWSKRKERIGVVVALILGMLISYGIMIISTSLDPTSKAKSLDKNKTQQVSQGASIGTASSASASSAASVSITARPATLASASSPSMSSNQATNQATNQGSNQGANGDGSAAELRIGVTGLDEASQVEQIINFVLIILIWIWWGGFFDFLSYVRQGRMMQEMRVQEQLNRYKRERNEAEMRLSVLASQVEPHFLFNTLSGVRAAMLSDPQRGIAIIDHLVEYLRLTIPKMRHEGQGVESVLSLQLDAVRAYLNVIMMRIPRLSFEVDAPTELLNKKVPPLMLISLVENAVKHGIEPKKGLVHIKVTAQTLQVDHQEKLQLSVIDNGVGFGGTSSGSGIGLSNIRERLKQLYGEHASLNLSMRDEGGIQACLILPMRSDVEDV
jgi:signal transduction histidine kinase